MRAHAEGSAARAWRTSTLAAFGGDMAMTLRQVALPVKHPSHRVGMISRSGGAA